MSAPTLTILQGDALELLPGLAPESVQCVVTSPPYWALRNYGIPDSNWPAIEFSPMPGLPAVHCGPWKGCLGQEESVADFVGHVVHVFRLVRNALRGDGTLWVNMGDSYAGARGGAQGSTGQCADRSAAALGVRVRNRTTVVDGLKKKDLIGQPWRIAFALQADGWVLRSEVIWHKPSVQPESVQDRCTRAHEHLFMFSKDSDYFSNFAAIREPSTGNAHPRRKLAPRSKTGASDLFPETAGTDEPTLSTDRIPHGWAVGSGSHAAIDHNRPGVHPKANRAPAGTRANASFSAAVTDLREDRNRRTVWTIPSEPLHEEHFAAFPTKLVEPCILASTRPGDVVLDPFAGTGTTGRVALAHGRRAVLIEANPAYQAIISRRTAVTIGLPLDGGIA